MLVKVEFYRFSRCRFTVDGLRYTLEANMSWSKNPVEDMIIDKNDFVYDHLLKGIYLQNASEKQFRKAFIVNNFYRDDLKDLMVVEGVKFHEAQLKRDLFRPTFEQTQLFKRKAWIGLTCNGKNYILTVIKEEEKPLDIIRTKKKRA